MEHNNTCKAMMEQNNAFVCVCVYIYIYIYICMCVSVTVVLLSSIGVASSRATTIYLKVKHMSEHDRATYYTIQTHTRVFTLRSDRTVAFFHRRWQHLVMTPRQYNVSL